MLSALRVVTGTEVGRNLRTRGGYVKINTLIVIKFALRFGFAQDTAGSAGTRKIRVIRSHRCHRVQRTGRLRANYQMQLVFDTEENRRKWVASKEHETAWPLASSMAEKFSWRGFDVVAKDSK